MRDLSRYRPHSLRIMGREFSVDYEDELEESWALGLCAATECEITIRDGQHPIEEADTVLHEALHALFYLLNFNLSSTTEEKIVRGTATGLIQIFLDNPDFLKYLVKVVNSQRR